MTEVRRKTTAKIEEDEIVFYEEEVPRYTTPCCNIKIPFEMPENQWAVYVRCDCKKKFVVWKGIDPTASRL